MLVRRPMMDRASLEGNGRGCPGQGKHWYSFDHCWKLYLVEAAGDFLSVAQGYSSASLEAVMLLIGNALCC